MFNHPVSRERRAPDESLIGLNIHECEDTLAAGLSIISPVFNEQEIIGTFVERVCGILRSLKEPAELILINDGSSDGTLAQLYKLASIFPEITVVELSRNFGQQAAYCAGLDTAQFRTVVMMDSDLQDSPEAIPLLITTLRDGGFNIVSVVRKKRKESFLKQSVYWLFYRLLRTFSNIEMTLDSGDFCAIDATAIHALRQLPERTRFLRGLRSWVGLKQTTIEIERERRAGGDSKYSLGKLMRLALDGFICFGTKPLQIVTGLGLILATVAFLGAGWYAFQRLVLGLSPPGFPTIIVAMCFFSGVQLLTLGLIGEYLGRVFDEVKARPVYIISRITRGKKLETDG